MKKKKFILREFGYDLADNISNFVGSWPFIIVQSIILTIWVIVNVKGLANFDPYPFILLNLFLSFQAAYATPMILMSSNRQAEMDRKRIEKDTSIEKETNKLAKETVAIIDKINKTLKQHDLYSEELSSIKAKIEELKNNDRYIIDLLEKKKHKPNDNKEI
jgi:uncharacterized membrane protein